MVNGALQILFQVTLRIKPVMVERGKENLFRMQLPAHVSLSLQVVLIVSGNLSFLNWLTIVPSLSCFDDSALSFLFGCGSAAKDAVLEVQCQQAAGHSPKPTKGAQFLYFEPHVSNTSPTGHSHVARQGGRGAFSGRVGPKLFA